LLDLLTNDKIDVSDALVKTNVEKLTVLPAGKRHRRATELLASEQMVALLRDLASATRTASSSSTRPRFCRRPRRACSPRTWARSSWSSLRGDVPEHAEPGPVDDRVVRARDDAAQQGEPDGNRAYGYYSGDSAR